jgi:hypothetical protein
MVGTEAPPQQRSEEKLKHMNASLPSLKFSPFPNRKSKIENPLAASIAGR